MQACYLEASNLACRRGERMLFQGLDLRLEAGQACRIAGPNGIGKTSLLRILGGLLRPFAGCTAHSGSVGLVDERPALDPQIPLAHALGFWAGVDGCANQRQNCEVMGVADLADVPVRYLSTGQKKRASFVRLLNQSSDIWLLDEPLNGLDTDGSALIETLVDAHCGRGGIAVVASHQTITLPSPVIVNLVDMAA